MIPYIYVSYTLYYTLYITYYTVVYYTVVMRLYSSNVIVYVIVRCWNSDSFITTVILYSYKCHTSSHCFGYIKLNGSDRCAYRKGDSSTYGVPGCSAILLLNVGDKIHVSHSGGTASQSTVWSHFQGKY